MDVNKGLPNTLNVENTNPSNITNEQTQAAMLDADAWVVEMRAKESQNIQSNESLSSENLTAEI
jgi:hypothetical protein